MVAERDAFGCRRVVAHRFLEQDGYTGSQLIRLKVPEVDAIDLDYVTTTFTDQSIVISGRNGADLMNWRLEECPNLYADISRVRGPVFAIEQLAAVCPPEKLLFGSLWPIQIIEATLWQVATAKIDDGVRDKILHGNARRLLT